MSAAETPEFAAIVAEFEDPYPLLAEIAEVTEQAPPRIDEAHTPEDEEEPEADAA